MAMATVKLIIDTDPGVDDALAIFLAFNSPEARASGRRPLALSQIGFRWRCWD